MGRWFGISLVLGIVFLLDITNGSNDFQASADNQTDFADHNAYCTSSADCDMGRNMFCDAVNAKCVCLPQTSYDSYGKECRKTYCYSESCPEGFNCYDGFCTKFCKINSYDCNTEPFYQNRYDHTYEVLTWVCVGVFVAILSLMLLTCLLMRCKRIQCKRVVTQHGQTILVKPNSGTPLLGSEMPTSVYSLCFCVPPVTTTTSYMPRCQCDAQIPAHHPVVVVAPTEYKDLPPTYFLEQTQPTKVAFV